MASNPFDDPPDYGTVSGQSTGFKKGQRGRAPVGSGVSTARTLPADEFSRRHQKVAAGVQEIKTLSKL